MAFPPLLRAVFDHIENTAAVSIHASRLGAQAGTEATGTKAAAGEQVAYRIAVALGQKSMMSVYVGAPSNVFPGERQDEFIRFLRPREGQRR